MTPMQIVAVAVLVGGILAIVLVESAVRWRKRRMTPRLQLRLSNPVVKSVRGKSDLCLEVLVDFINASRSPLEIASIEPELHRRDGSPLEPRRILGVERNDGNESPADIRLRLPIRVAAGQHVTYRFCIYYDDLSRRVLETGRLRFRAKTAEGALVESWAALLPPSQQDAAKK